MPDLGNRPLPQRQDATRKTAPVTTAAAPARERPAPVARPGKPDPRPMRVVYGATAVAAVGVIAVGLVQPGSTPSTTADSNQVSDAQPAADGGGGYQQPQQGQKQHPQPADVQVNHVIRYIHLQPGQTAPPGATVITPDAPQPRVVVTHVTAPVPPPAHNPPPRPAPPPVVHTRPSGHP